MSAITLEPGATTLSQLSDIYRQQCAVNLSDSAKPAVTAAAQVISQVVTDGAPVYGVNTGFGKLASVQIAATDTETLQRNLVLSHCCGVGENAPAPVVHLMLVLKLLSLGRGASGVRWEVIDCIESMLAANLGASGDLAPLAHMAAVMIGEGQASYDGQTLYGATAMAAAGIEPITLGAKEGLALINGTQFSTAYALAALFDAWRNARAAVVTGSMSTDAIMGSTAPLEASIHALRGHRGQIDVANASRALMDGSQIRESHRDGDTRVQDPYCIRCQPQVLGACIDLLRQAGVTLEIEANAVTDNPIVVAQEQAVLSGGNFHAEPVAFAADQIALAIAEIGAIAQRRVALMVDPTLSFDLPPFLTPSPGLNSGFMIAEVTTAALMSENKHLANPCSTDSTPTSANQEDHVSMAAHGSRRLERMNENLAGILGVELLCSARGVEFRAPVSTSVPLQRAIDRLRQDVTTLNEDRYLASDLSIASGLVKSGEICAVTGSSALESLGAP